MTLIRISLRRFNSIERVMKMAFREVLKIHLERNVPMGIAANMLGVGRIAEAVQFRGISA
jgi:glutamate dehydrogenase/leucine dehydrogenase